MSKRDAAYDMAIAAAKAELAEINSELSRMEPLVRRKAIIESFIQNATALRNAAAHGVATVGSRHIELPFGSGKSASASMIIPGRGANIWEGARDVLADAKHPMTAPWIVDAMRARGWKFEAKWTTEIVRGAMQRKLDVFEVPIKGFYVLKAWPSDMKKVSKDLEFKARHNMRLDAAIKSTPDDDFVGTTLEVKKD